jgi:flagellar basal-body rod protein FlgF
MDRLIYTAMTGANAAAHRQAVLSNNLANASTNGFRAELSTYRAVPLRGDGATTRVFALEATSGHLDTARCRAAHRPRAGRHGHRQRLVCGAGAGRHRGLHPQRLFEVSPDGTLMTSNGLTVLSDGGGPSPCRRVPSHIGHDGTLSAKVAGNQPAKRHWPPEDGHANADDPLKRGDDGLFRTTSGDPLPNDAAGTAAGGRAGRLQRQPIETMVGMIQTARQFERRCA